jgi:hypothetical protein
MIAGEDLSLISTCRLLDPASRHFPSLGDTGQPVGDPGHPAYGADRYGDDVGTIQPGQLLCRATGRGTIHLKMQMPPIHDILDKRHTFHASFPH